MSVRKTLVRNTMFNAGGRLWEAVCNILLVAYIVPRVGLAGWGLWALLDAFTGYVALFDFGIGSGFAKYVAEHSARKEDHAISAIVSTGFCFYLLFAIVLVAVGWPCIGLIVQFVSWLHPDRVANLADTKFLGDVPFLLRWALVLFVASNCIAPFTAVQTGLQRMGVTNVIGFVASLIKIVATIAFLETGHGVRGLLYANIAVFAFFSVTGIVMAHRLAPALRVRLRYVDRETLKRLFSFGWRTQVSRLSNLVMFQTDRLIVGAAYGQLGFVGVYRIGEELAGKMRQVPTLLLTAIMPAASDLDARGDQERLSRLYLLSSKYVAAITLPLVAFCVGTSGLLIRTWMGPDVPHLEIAAWVNRILALGYLANIIPGAGVSIALGKGRPDVQMKAGLIATVSNITLTIALVFPFGLYGVALGTALSTVLSTAWFISAMRNVVDVRPAELIRVSLLWPAIASLPGFAICLIADAFSVGLAGRAANGLALAGCAFAFGAAYLATIRFTPFLDAFDVQFLAKSLKLDRIPGFGLLTRRAARDA